MTLRYPFLERSVAEQFVLLQVFSAHAHKTSLLSFRSRLSPQNFSSLLGADSIRAWEAAHLTKTSIDPAVKPLALYCSGPRIVKKSACGASPLLSMQAI